eukprot:CAMPEP_0170372818 /NCGR_PEP_ID=MMETSP0117_2-20130122/9750_1 /TAXON_ID=400756 /ORGANISM="Durinskia baltica, Strain CSIRO CS-38" /LENGTH=323 /DNA_ID=CAMNT_0010627691 /DNA_START=168 /DNA_END=1138 /DNA_ORIENTATION=-
MMLNTARFLKASAQGNEGLNNSRLVNTVSIANASAIDLNSINALISQPQQQEPAGSRKVRFSPIIRVSLVPCRADFQSDFFMLFWEREDYQSFKEDALRELRAYWIEHKTTVKEAIFELYQPKPTPEVEPVKAVHDKLLTHVDSMGVMKNLGHELNEMLFQSTSNTPQHLNREDKDITNSKVRSQSSNIISTICQNDVGSSLLEHVTSDGINSITPLRKDAKETKTPVESAARKEFDLTPVPAAHLVLHNVSAPAILVHSEDEYRSPPLSSLSISVAGRIGTSNSDTALTSSYTPSASSALAHISGESTSSCASSYEAPIMIC